MSRFLIRIQRFAIVNQLDYLIYYLASGDMRFVSQLPEKATWPKSYSNEPITTKSRKIEEYAPTPGTQAASSADSTPNAVSFVLERARELCSNLRRNHLTCSHCRPECKPPAPTVAWWSFRFCQTWPP